MSADDQTTDSGLGATELERIYERGDLFEAAWRRGDGPRIEDVLDEGRPGERSELLADLIGREIELRRGSGERPEPGEYHARFPDDRAAVDAAFDEFLGRETVDDEADAALDQAGIGTDTVDLTRGVASDTEGPGGPRARLELLGELGRGGMGVVLRGRDNLLDRNLAVKVMHVPPGDDAGAERLRRFVEEARIGGRLQHPGVVPVYDLGTFPDRRPYFTMKLVGGRTLAELLRDRTPADSPAVPGSEAAPGPPYGDLPRLLPIFEAICQTVAYAHAEGVIHRDLKPSNVMVGDFGEVQVMDWGLAKVLRRGGEGVSDGDSEPPGADVAHGLKGSDSGLSLPGSIMGTPAYMPPEQARGEVGRVDERADVFALGSMLCELLTGRPAYAGRTLSEVHRKAASADLGDARQRLGHCGADPELIALAQRCLTADLADRPRDARAVAEAVVAHLAGVQERLRIAELDRARAEAQATEERRRRKLQLGLAASLITLLILGGLGAAYEIKRRHNREAHLAVVLAEATTLRYRAANQPDDPAGWREALAAVRRVEDALADSDREATLRLASLRNDAQAGLATAERGGRLLQDLSRARATAREAGLTGVDSAYAAAFAKAGLDLEVLGVAEITTQLRRFSQPRVVELASYLDHWSSVRRQAGRPTDDWRRPLEAARKVDPDKYRTRLRAQLAAADLSSQAFALRSLAEAPDSADLPAPTALVLADALARVEDKTTEIALLKRVVARQPDDVWLHFTLAGALHAQRPPRHEEALRYYTAAWALRPETGHELAHLLERMSRGTEAEAVFRDLIRRWPDDASSLDCFGVHLQKRGRPQEAYSVLDQAVDAARKAVRLEPQYARAHFQGQRISKTL